MFGLGAVIITIVTYLTPPESEETLREFYLRCKPPGLWGPVVRKLGEGEVKRSRQETLDDVIDCVLAIASCAGWLAIVLTLFACRYGLCAVSAGVTGVTTWLFIARWAKRGVFKSL